MTDIPITANERKAQFTGNTGLGPFAFTFNILTGSDIRVIKNNTVLTLTAEYTIATNANGTGSVTLTGSGNGTALISSDVLTIIGNRQLARTSDYVQGGNLFAEALNEDLDSIVIMMQQLDEKVSRTIRIDAGDVAGELLIPSQSQRASKYLAFGANGEPVATAGTTSTLVVSAFAETFLDDNDATEFFTTMGVTSSAAELNVLDGIPATLTAAELGYVDGVTSAIQTQLDAKALQSTTIATGTGLTGGGDLSASRTISPDIASQAEAEAGTASNKLMTPQRTAQAIAALTPEPADPTTAQVLTAYAGATARGVGSYTTAFYAVSLALGLNNGASIAVGTEVAGSSLRVATSTTSTNTTYYVSPFETLSAGTNSFPTGNTTTLSGTWRLMTSGSYGRLTNNDPETYVWYPHLWLRVS